MSLSLLCLVLRRLRLSLKSNHPILESVPSRLNMKNSERYDNLTYFSYLFGILDRIMLNSIGGN